MKTKTIIVDIVFNSWGLQDENDERLTKEWIDNRMDIFMRFTAQSLLNQTSQNYTAIIKYDPRCEHLMKEALEKYRPLPDNIRFVNKSAAPYVYYDIFEGYDEGYIVRLDSDDMYDKDYIAKLDRYVPQEGTQMIVNQKGYIYDARTGKVATYYRESPPFYTMIYNTKDFIDGYRYPLKGHMSIIEMQHEILGEGNFMVVVHGQNTSTDFALKQGSELIEDEKTAKQIINNFMGQPGFIERIKSMVGL